MGLTVLKVEVINPGDLSRSELVECLIDSGAVYTVIPAEVLARLGIEPMSEEELRLADSSRIVRRLGIAVFRYQGRVGGATVIFGEPGDMTLMGVTTLESMGLQLDPLRRELRPLPMILARSATPRFQQ